MNKTKMSREHIKDFLENTFPDDAEQMLLLDGFDDAFVGVAYSFGGKVTTAYDYDQIIRTLMEDGTMSYEDAVEYYEFNISGAYVGEYTPVYIHKYASPDSFFGGDSNDK